MLRMLTILGLTLAPSYGVAQQQAPCGPRPAIIQQLLDRYGEAQIGQGVTANGSVLEFYANPETGSFSALLSQPQAQGVISCVVAYGRDWQIIEYQAPADPA